MTVDQMLTAEIKKITEKLETMDPKSKEYEVLSNRLDKLLSKAVEMDTKYLDAEIKREQNKTEHEDKQQQMKEEKVDRIVKNVLTGLSIASTAALTIWGTKVSLNFEKEGVVSTMAGRAFINKLFLKK